MTEQEILEGNRLLAFFDGGVIEKNAPNFYELFTHPDMSHILWVGVYPDDLEYHDNWQWLMPVVEKIENLGFDSRIMGNNSDGGYLCDFVDISNNEAACKISYETKIEAVYLAVIEFIKWYNNEKDRSGQSL